MGNELLKKIRGTLVGCAYGDAMGMATEFLSREAIDRLFPGGVTGFNASTEEDILGRKFTKGSVTDDTTHTVIICKTIIENNGVFDTSKYIGNLKKWMDENPELAPFVMGPNTKRVITAISEGADINQTGKFGTTNGSAMKISPIGIIKDYRNKKDFMDCVENVCLPVHHTQIAVSGASCIAACVSYAVRGGSNIEEMWGICLEMAESAHGRGTVFPTASLSERLNAIHELVKSVDQNTARTTIERLYGAGMETVEAIPAVMGIVTLADGDPYKAARIAANMVGDSDTLGAMATAICGAMNPVFKQEDMDFLSSVNGIDFEQLAAGLLPYVENC